MLHLEVILQGRTLKSCHTQLYCSMLQCVAVCFSVLQCVAACCSVLHLKVVLQGDTC